MPYYNTQDDCSLYYELLGEGPEKSTIVFVNGTLQTTVYWKMVSRAFTHRYRMLIYDCRGQGESNLGQAPLTLDQHAEDLKNLLSALGIEKASVVGISHGARVALTLAEKRPDLIVRMVLCSISTKSSYRAKMIVRSWFEILQRHSLDAMVWAAVPIVFGGRFTHENGKVMERMVKTIVRRNKTASLRVHLEAMQRYPSLATQLKKTPYLVLVITGEDDPLVTETGAAEIANRCGGRHAVIPHVGHSIPAEAPEEFTRLVLDFLGDVTH